MTHIIEINELLNHSKARSYTVTSTPATSEWKDKFGELF